jgi:hypothetical protein
MDLTTIDAAAPAPALRIRMRQIVALVVLALSVLLAVWGTPREASPTAFLAALRAGEVSGWEFAGGNKYGAERSSALEINWGETQPGESVVWADSVGRLYRTDLDTVLSQLDPATVTLEPSSDPIPQPDQDVLGPLPDQQTTVDVGRTIAANAPAGSGLGVDGLGWAGKLGWPLSVVMLAAILLLVLGPQPRRQTKWAAFWYLLIPLGVGLAWLVVRDSPWSERMNALPEPPPRWRGQLVPGISRRGGGSAFGISWIVSIVLAAVVFALLWSVPGFGARPGPAAGSSTWKVVWTSGSTGTLVQ